MTNYILTFDFKCIFGLNEQIKSKDLVGFVVSLKWNCLHLGCLNKVVFLMTETGETQYIVLN